jgi:hypothetical protein
MFSPLRYIRAHPFSVMALCNIVGDLGYLGFAFKAAGFVSLPKLAGALFTMLAHTILLAYGDDQARKISHEKGGLSKFILEARILAQRLTASMPSGWGQGIRKKPVGIPFLMLALNGIGLLTDAVMNLHRHSDWASISQVVLGILIAVGCSAFAAADFAKGQRAADILTKVAPAILTGATLANVALAMTTWNPFILFAVVAFAISNLAGFFTKIDKKEPISAGI